jgi:hypothetical protein
MLEPTLSPGQGLWIWPQLEERPLLKLKIVTEDKNAEFTAIIEEIRTF